MYKGQCHGMVKGQIKSHHALAHLHPLTNVPTKYPLPTPYSFLNIAHNKMSKVKVTIVRSKVKSRSHHVIAHLYPKPMSLPSINILHLRVSEIQPGQPFSRVPPTCPPIRASWAKTISKWPFKTVDKMRRFAYPTVVTLM